MLEDKNNDMSVNMKEFGSGKDNIANRKMPSKRVSDFFGLNRHSAFSVPSPDDPENFEGLQKDDFTDSPDSLPKSVHSEKVGGVKRSNSFTVGGSARKIGDKYVDVCFTPTNEKKHEHFNISPIKEPMSANLNRINQQNALVSTKT